MCLDADGLNPTVYWIITAAMLAGLVTAGAWAWMRLRHHSRRVETDPRRLAGTATAHEVIQSASAKALLRRANIEADRKVTVSFSLRTIAALYEAMAGDVIQLGDED